MDIKQSSFEFHCQLESPYAFFRREWKPAVVCTGLFSILLLAVILYVDPAFFYPRIQTDPLNYYLKARALIDTGSTSARWAVNLKPFAYASFPGVLRIPEMLVFNDFDDQLRAIQIFNIPIVASIPLMSAYIFSWTQPVGRHWIVIVIAFAFTLFSPHWISNVFLPLADAPYAAFTLAAILVSMSVVCSAEPLSRRPVAIVAFTILFVLAFLIRFTAPVVLVFPIVLGLGRWHHRTVPRRTKLAIATAIFFVLVALVVLNFDTIFGRYVREPIAFLIRGDKIGMALNLLGAAVPSQIIPTFQQGFVHPPIADLYHTNFFEAPADAAWLGVGLIVCAFVIAGMWKSRDRFLPEILYFLAPLPVLGLIMPSTARYLMTYQPFVWIFFYVGLSHAYAQFGSHLPRIVRTRTFAIATIGLAAAVMIGLRAWRLSGTASERFFAVSVSSAPDYVNDVSSTFRGLRKYLETLPRSSTLLVGARGTLGRWDAISRLQYYSPDSNLVKMAVTKKVYVLVECGTGEECQAWPPYIERQQEHVSKFGPFHFTSVYAARGLRSRVEVLRIDPTPVTTE